MCHILKHTRGAKVNMIVPIVTPRCWDRMGNHLREIRTARKMSLRKLGKLAGIDHSVIGKIERGEVRLASHHIEILCPILGVRPEELVADGAPLSEKEREFLDVIGGLSDDNLARVIDLAKALKR